jgi:Bacterial Ig domain
LPNTSSNTVVVFVPCLGPPPCYSSNALVSAAGMQLQLSNLADGVYQVRAFQFFTVQSQLGSYSYAGPASAALTLTVDTAAPGGTVMIAGTVINGQLATKNPSLALALNFTDTGGSGVSQMAFAVNGGAYSAPAAYAPSKTLLLSGADGLYSVSTQVTDLAGNSVVVTKTVVLDTTRPVVTLISPPAGSSYTPGQSVTFSYTASDGTGVGIMSSSATLDGTPIVSGALLTIDKLAPGTHTIVITVTDRVGNTTVLTSSFEVHASSANSLITAVNDGIATGQITKTYGATLISILNKAQGFIDRGQYAQARAALLVFEGAVATGRSSGQITPTYAALLIAWSADLRAHLP